MFFVTKKDVEEKLVKLLAIGSERVREINRAVGRLGVDEDDDDQEDGYEAQYEDQEAYEGNVIVLTSPEDADDQENGYEDEDEDQEDYDNVLYLTQLPEGSFFNPFI